MIRETGDLWGTDKGNLGEWEKVYLNHGGGYKDILTCQNSMNCTIKYIVFKLFLNRVGL